MELATVWFILIAVLWIGYFVLEGFDFGVGMLLPALGRDDIDRRILINTIGPVWDGNEVWLIVAGGGTFAAFPEWYATMFSGFYLILLVILLALIARGVAFEFRGKHDSDRWRRGWDRAIFWGSLIPSALWGVAFGNIIAGVPIDARHVYTGNLLTLLNPYALLAGLVTLGLFLLHGAVFLSLKTGDELRARARTVTLRLAPVVVLIVVLFLAVTQILHGKPVTLITSALAVLALLAGVGAAFRHRDGWAFTATAATIILATGTLFINLWPNVLPSSTAEAYSLTITNASSSPYTLLVMTWVAAIFLPLVLLYEGWSYWVFRQRLTRPPS
ncbi:cytochrome d ubiquinol oxidase subunit II [Microtetraspora sp. NBRC 16547]|uniref:cytochrome d ubiquinol oxidase subunit II n=1 Tax=Microtetraspora sp. NBRC 16547 TaxID=3030993 RepID=UPI0024A41016|nr:cytochrome d ubiquinol oxidase subunit II [Microtetraspora sp. NBRC 16547]GLX01394.1 cytochrome c oxidase assembly protein [Microtetraspora sp. NBRC 16547]